MKNLFTKEYIEKCVNNPDLQNMWEPEEGNCFKNGVNIELVLDDWIHKIDKKYNYYIPRQDELQIILKQKIERYRNMTDLKFDFNMRHCIFKLYCNKILSILTLNDIWLIFFMHDIFGKIWIPENKAWVAR